MKSQNVILGENKVKFLCDFGAKLGQIVIFHFSVEVKFASLEKKSVTGLFCNIRET